MNRIVLAVLAACAITLAAGESQAFFDKIFGGDKSAQSDSNPAPQTGSSTEANKNADKALYKPIEYANANVQGPLLIVLPGEVKSNNASFTQKFGPNNIADFGEMELTRANFRVLERANLGPLLQEFQLAYSLGDQKDAAKLLGRGKLKSTKWVVKFDVLKAEPVAGAKSGFDGSGIASVLGALAGTRGGQAGAAAVGTVKNDDEAKVWIIGMRYKIINAATTEQVASGYTEEKMEVGATAGSVLGISKGASGGLTLDSLVQRLVQTCVAEMDARYKKN